MRGVFVKADKSSNYYLMEKERQGELMQREIHKVYKKGGEDIEANINKEAKEFATKLEIDDRVFKLEKRKAMITIKDHKQGFMDNPQCRLLNPSKSELGRAAKQILTRINKELKRITGLTQWESDQKCLEWFNALENKPRLRFIKADIDPSISEELLTWASTLLRLLT